MSQTSTRPREPGSGFEIALIALIAVVVVAAVVTWLGAKLSTVISGGTVRGGLTDWLTVTGRLMTGRPPRDAWGPLATDLPGAPIYWICTAVAALAVTLTGVVVYRLWRRVAGPGDRRRFGQPTDARQATSSDVLPIVVDSVHPPTGRMLLGQMLPRGPLLATEDRQRHPLPKRRARRQGNRGSVALIGPTGSGKTALAASAIATWDGPVVAVSVKRDLYDITAAARKGRGDIAVFDPGMATGLPTARWSPLEAVTTSTGALRTGRALAQAIPKGGVTNADYWAKHGEKLLAAFMGVAGLSRLLKSDAGTAPYPLVNMQHIATWVTMMSDATDPVINRILKAGLEKRQPLEVRLIARHASTTFVGVGKEDHKIRSSIYSTASHAIDPWLEPSVAHSATDDPRRTYASDETWDRRPRFIDLEWLMAGPPGHSNTLYLTATQPEFERLSPVLGGLLCDLKDTIHAWDVAGRRLDKAVLFLIDEAGQLELAWLPAEVSTISALGAFFVTCWQNLAQMHHRYGTLADAVLSGHRTKCFFAGIDDLTTMKYITTLLGHEHVLRHSSSHDVPSMLANSTARRSVSQSDERVDFAPANAIRQMNPGEAVLIHGTLPPIHLEAIRWWKRPDLAKLVPLDDAGEPRPPDDLPTCPLTPASPRKQTPVIDEETLTATLAELPAVKKRRALNTSRPTGAAPDELRFSRAGEEKAVPPVGTDGHQPVRRRSACMNCNKVLRPGDGQQVEVDGRTLTTCYPTCSSAPGGTDGAAPCPDDLA